MSDNVENDAGLWRGLRRFFSWYFRSWFDFPARRPYPTVRRIPPEGGQQ
jgi:hypothetical protein